MSTAPEIDYDTTIPDWITADPARRKRLNRAHDPQRWGWVQEFWIAGEAERDLSTVYTTGDAATYGARQATKVPHPENIAGTIVVFLGLDRDHHEVHVDAFTYLGDLGAIRQAITELERVRDRLEQFEALR